MSFDFYAIAPHRLDVSSVQSLGNDVAHRLHVNISCYAKDEYNINAEMKGSYCWSDSIHLGSVVLDESFPQWFLKEEFYNIKKYHKKYGCDLYDHPYFRLNPLMSTAFSEARNTIWYQLFSDKDEKHPEGQIFSGLWACGFHHFIGWNNFYQSIGKHGTASGSTRLLPFRRELYIAIRKFGGDRVLFFNDEKDAYRFIYFAMKAENWLELFNEIKTSFGNNILNISRLVRENADFEFNGESMAFYDDFSDLKFTPTSIKESQIILP